NNWAGKYPIPNALDGRGAKKCENTPGSKRGVSFCKTCGARSKPSPGSLRVFLAPPKAYREIQHGKPLKQPS
ncbi:MAG: hypothetical protein AAF765_14495, partial [Bacteroidota bacterium]